MKNIVEYLINNHVKKQKLTVDFLIAYLTQYLIDWNEVGIPDSQSFSVTNELNKGTVFDLLDEFECWTNIEDALVKNNGFDFEEDGEELRDFYLQNKDELEKQIKAKYKSHK